MDSQLQGSEEEFEMEPIALSSPAPQAFQDTRSNRDDIGEESQVGNIVCVKMRHVLVKIRENCVGIKMLVVDQWLKHCGCTGNLGTTRVYHVWPGNNVFFFHGRFICGPDPRGLLLTTVSIILSSWIFAMYSGDDLRQHSRLMVPCSMFLTLTVLVNLLLVSTIDPGIIPRNDQETIEEIGASNGIRKKRVIVNGVELKLKYCRICKIFRPPRSCHCAICDNCVENFDHHCPWIGQCVALRNYRFYLTFVVSALIFFIYMFAFTCRRIHQRMLLSSIGFFGMLMNFPEALALVLFSFAAIWFLGGLSIFHVYLIAVNQTAYENFRQCYMGSKNPFDKGILGNIKEILFAPLPSARVDFRAEVQRM